MTVFGFRVLSIRQFQGYEVLAVAHKFVEAKSGPISTEFHRDAQSQKELPTPHHDCDGPGVSV